MSQTQTTPATLEEAIAAVVVTWNNLLALPQGARLAHRLFGSHLAGGAPPGAQRTGGHCFATKMDGTARTIGELELAQIPGEIGLVREEAEQAARRARGEE